MSAYQLAYVSLCRTTIDAALLSNLLDVAQRLNRQDGITGVLMCHDGLFFQILEGEQTVVEACYARIKADKRHTGVSLVWEDMADHRTFGNWSMGYAGPTKVAQNGDDNGLALVDLNSDEDLTAQNDSIALLLAHQMFMDFSQRPKFRAR